MAKALAKTGLPTPEVGFELADEEGAVAVQAELAWPAKKVALIDAGSRDAAAFTEAGWKIFVLPGVGSDLSSIVAAVVEALKS